MENKNKKESFENKDPVSREYTVSNGCAYLFIGLIICGLIIYKLYKFVVDNISENTLLALKIVGISLLALFVAYVTFKVFKLIYCIGYNIFLFIDKKFSIAQKYHKIISPKTKQTQMQDYINSLQKEIDELKYKLSESQNGSNITNEDFMKTAVADSEFEIGSDEDYDYIIKGAEVAVNAGQLSTTMLQKKLKLTYVRASKIMDQLEELGIISPPEGSKPRKVLIDKEQYEILLQKWLKNEKSNVNQTYDKVVVSKLSEHKNQSAELTYDEIRLLPEYKIIKDYTSKLKIIDLRKFINELSPFDKDRTCLVLSTLIFDGILTEYTNNRLLYTENNAILSSVDNMSGNGIEFEHFTVELLLKNGFTKVKRTQSSGDYGIDVLAEKDSVTYAIQCKCYSSPVGNKAVQEAYSGKDFYRCMVAVVFTNNYFTKSAIETAKQNNVILWDRNKLIELIKPLQTSNHMNDELYKEHFSSLLKEIGTDIITNYSLHNILLKIDEVHIDDNGVLWELELQNIDDIANIHLYIDELQEKLNAEVILREPLEYPKVYIYVNYSKNLLNAYNNFAQSRL